MFSIKLFFQYYLFSVLLRKKEQNRQNRSQTSQNFFSPALMIWDAQLFAADHMSV